MKMDLRGVAPVVIFIGLFASAEAVYPQQQTSRSPELELVPVQGNISMLAGAGGNITVQVGRDGVLLVDTGVAAMTDKVLAAIRTLSNRQITYIVNTNDRSDHIGGNENIAAILAWGLITAFFIPTGWIPNENIAKIGRPLDIARAAQASVFIIAFNTILDRMTDSTPPIPERAWPNDVYSVPQKNLYFNGEAVQIFHQPATTDGNSFVLFRRSDVISTGDLFDPTQYPIIDVKSGGSLQGVLEGLNRLRQMAVPADHVEGGTMLIPGHGRVCDTADLDIYQQMVTVVRDRLQDMIKRGMTLDQVKAAKPTLDYDPVYGSSTGNWTTEMFIEAAYNSLSKPDTRGARGSQ